MKHLHCFLYILLFSSFGSYGQNVYPHFSELKGIEDYNGNTNLLYRISSTEKGSNYTEFVNDIRLLNVQDNIDSLFQNDGYNDYYPVGGWFTTVKGYDFWEKNPRKFIVCGESGPFEASPFVNRFDQKDLFHQFGSGVDFIKISRQIDSLVYCTQAGLLFKSTTGGFNWDTVSNFNAVSLSPYNDKVLYASEYGQIIKTIDGGLTKTIVASFPINVYKIGSFIYEKDTSYIYTTYYYNNQEHYYYRLIVSNNSGNANSWQEKLTSTSQIYLSVDNSVSGSVYLATGRYIYHSTDFGNSFSLFHAFDRSLVGIYKKPGSSKIYAATYNTIYELDGSAINIIKQIPVDPEVFKFDPLDIGNKWVYKCLAWNFEYQENFINSTEIVQDTVLADQLTYKQIKNTTYDSLIGGVSYSYERIDSSNGKVYFWSNISHAAYQGDDLSMNLGDTIYHSRYGFTQDPTSFDSLNSKTIFGISRENHVYYSPGNWYSLTKDIGITYHLSGGDQNGSSYYLKGAIIKGVYCGDTSLVVGITDKYPTLPDEYTLSQNYPNPFNPATTINYSIPKAGQVKLTVYNAIGSKVATILNAYKPAGNYSVQFNASSLASGIYLYRLESGQFFQTKKMILLK